MVLVETISKWSSLKMILEKIRSLVSDRSKVFLYKNYLRRCIFLAHRIERYHILSPWQVGPVNLPLHLQTTFPFSLWQVPPFWHGSLWHPSIAKNMYHRFLWTSEKITLVNGLIKIISCRPFHHLSGKTRIYRSLFCRDHKCIKAGQKHNIRKHIKWGSKSEESKDAG